MEFVKFNKFIDQSKSNDYKSISKKYLLKQPSDYPKNSIVDVHNQFFPKTEDKKDFINGKVIRYIFHDPEFEQEPGELEHINKVRQYFENVFKDDKNSCIYALLKKLSNADILKFLYSNEFDITEAADSIHKNILQFYRLTLYEQMKDRPHSYLNYPIDGDNLKENTLNLFNNGCCYIFGRDHCLRPIIIILVKKQEQVMNIHNEKLTQSIGLIIRNYLLKEGFIPGQIENLVQINNYEGMDSSTTTEHRMNFINRKFSINGILLKSMIYRSYIVNLVKRFKGFFVRNFLNLADKRYVTKIRITTKNFHHEMFSHISKYQLEKKHGGYIENMTKDFWPSKAPNRHYWLENEREKDRYITPEKYYEIYKSGYFDKSLHGPCWSQINFFEEKEKEGGTFTKFETCKFQNSIGFIRFDNVENNQYYNESFSGNETKKDLKVVNDEYDYEIDGVDEDLSTEEGVLLKFGGHKSLGIGHTKSLKICMPSSVK